MRVFTAITSLFSFAAVTAALPDTVFARAACNKDLCYRSVAATGTKPGTAKASADCSAFMRTTITPCTFTSTVTSTATTTSVTSTFTTVATAANTNNVKRDNDADLVRRVGTCTPVSTRALTTVPTYAAPACASSALRYASACSCLGVTATVITVATPTTVVTSTTTTTVNIITTTTTTTTTSAASTATSACNVFKMEQWSSSGGPYDGNYAYTYLTSAGTEDGQVSSIARANSGIEDGARYLLNADGTISPQSNPSLFWSTLNYGAGTYPVLEDSNNNGLNRIKITCVFQRGFTDTTGLLSCSTANGATQLYINGAQPSNGLAAVLIGPPGDSNFDAIYNGITFNCGADQVYNNPGCGEQC